VNRLRTSLEIGLRAQILTGRTGRGQGKVILLDSTAPSWISAAAASVPRRFGSWGAADVGGKRGRGGEGGAGLHSGHVHWLSPL
jgi:hypothetical protein